MWTVFPFGEHACVVGHVDVQGPHHISLESILDTEIKLLIVAAEEIQGSTKIDPMINIDLIDRVIVKIDRQT